MSAFNPTSILLFEKKTTYNLFPFSIMHPSWELRVGALTLYEKWLMHFPAAKLSFHGRPLQSNSFRERHGLKHEAIVGNVLALQANVVPDTETMFSLKQTVEEHPGESLVFMQEDSIVGVYVPAQPDVQHSSDALTAATTEFAKCVEVRVTTLQHLWDALTINAKQIGQDLALMQSKLRDVEIPSFVHTCGSNEIVCETQPTLLPGVVLDSTSGPIVFGNNATVMHNSVIMGPAFIGDNCTIKSGAKIYPECTFGPWCKVGGELENTIFQAYSNKQHDGFMGHSFISEWVNIGADTNTSDLKNNYGNVRVVMGQHTIDTGRMFLGFLCGDHTKTAINTQLNTGTLCGVSSNIFTTHFPPKYIPSFSWGGSEHSEPYSIDKALETAARVMSRRKKTMLSIEETILRREYESQTSNF